jgi:hypothetical protein
MMLTVMLIVTMTMMMMMMTSWDAGFHRGKLAYLTFT